MGIFSAKSKFAIKKEYKLSEESALEIVVDFCKMYDIDVEAQTDEDNKARIESILDALVEYVRLGYIEINDDKSVIQHLQHPPGDVHEIKYSRIGGRHKRVMDKFKETEQFGKVYAILGASSGFSSDMIEKLSGIDLKVAEGLGLLFLV